MKKLLITLTLSTLAFQAQATPTPAECAQAQQTLEEYMEELSKTPHNTSESVRLQNGIKAMAHILKRCKEADIL